MGQLANRMGARRRVYREIKIRELPCRSVSTHMISEACAPVNWSVEPESSTREREQKTALEQSNRYDIVRPWMHKTL